MKLRAVRRPDGTIDVGGASYRLDERDDRFVVIRADDGRELGTFRIKDATHSEVIDANDDSRAVIDAVAELFSTPRGLLPLQ
jgi:hypothetical protein